jgi:hypothetical protein
VTKEIVRHASRLDDSNHSLCGDSSGRLTKPKESVNCPTCRAILNHVHDRYPEHASHTDWRLTKEQSRQAAREMYADLVGGENEG